MTDVKLNCYCCIAILETIELCAKIKQKRLSSGSFKNVIYKICLQITYLLPKPDHTYLLNK